MFVGASAGAGGDGRSRRRHRVFLEHLGFATICRFARYFG
jgi:hypothetical protein